MTKDDSKQEWSYRLRSEPPPLSGEAFEITVSEITDSEVRVTAMYHHWEAEYIGKGIPDALLPKIRRDLDKVVCSSRFPYRSDDATKVWERLLKAGVAEYSNSENVYRIP